MTAIARTIGIELPEPAGARPCERRVGLRRLVGSLAALVGLLLIAAPAWIEALG